MSDYLLVYGWPLDDYHACTQWTGRNGYGPFGCGLRNATVHCGRLP